MARESAAVGAEATRAALEASAFVTREALSISVKIDSPIVAGVALAAGAAVTLGAFYLLHRRDTENATRNALEGRNEIGAADPEVANIEEGSIIVKLRCHTQQSFLQFVKDFKEKKVKRRLEEEFKKIGFDKELEVTIVNTLEVFQREHEIRSLGDPEEDVKATDEEVNLDPPRQVIAATSSSTVLPDRPRYHVSEEKTNGTKLARLLIDEGTGVLRKVLHTIYPPPTLIAVLNRYKAKLERLRSKRVIFKNQWEMLFPSSDDPPDTETFDISLLHLLLREICHLTAPSTGWHNMPADDDNSLEANLVRIKCLRNELCHSVSTGITNTEFENKWSKIASSLEALEMSVQRKKYAEKIEALKKDPIDHDVQRRLEEQAKIWEKVREQEKIDTTIFSTRCCLPDRIPEECVFGRNQEIEHVKKMAEGGDIPVVLVTGGPGFGKTTVAKRVAHELAKSEKEGTVLFCSLLTKTNFNEVAVEMINSCGTISTQVPENPGQWLRDWSKRVQNQVTFVLDNADSVLESSDRESFISILSDVRKLSRQKVAFVITARKTFENPDLQSCEVRLGPLSAEQARNLLISRVKVYGDAPQNLSRADYIAKNLCGCVPLALCIVGSLLSDYSEETLIESLEKEPLAVLEDDQRSVEKAIKTSFDLLKKPEQETFILLSLFQGPFDIDAVQAVTKAKCSISGALPISILRSLKNRSLVEKPYSRRYQMHPLIKSYAKKLVETSMADFW